MLIDYLRAPAVARRHPKRPPDSSLLPSHRSTVVTAAEDRVDRLEARTALLPPEAEELDAPQAAAAVAAEPGVQQEAAVAAVAAAEPVAQQEAVAVAAEPGAQQEAVAAAAEPDAQQEAVAVAAEPDAQQEAVVVVAAEPDAQPEAVAAAAALCAQQAAMAVVGEPCAQQAAAGPSGLRQPGPSVVAAQAAAVRLWFRGRPASAPGQACPRVSATEKAAVVHRIQAADARLWFPG
jgi:hypothetical protein